MKKPPIIILHGWGLSAHKFEPLVRALKKAGFQAFAPDFPGFGLSNVPDKPFFLRDYAVFLAEYLKKHTMSRPILIGHSFGGRVALKYNFLYPKNVRALILSGTPGFTPVPRKKLLLFISLAKVGNLLCSIPPLNLFKHSIRRWYYYVVGAKEYYRAEGVMRDTFKHIVQEELTPLMKTNAIPTLLLWGALDIITPPSIAHRMKRVMPHTKVIVVPDMDHGFPFKHPEAFISHIEPFIQSL